jgi:hypothetical protein
VKAFQFISGFVLCFIKFGTEQALGISAAVWSQLDPVSTIIASLVIIIICVFLEPYFAKKVLKIL